MRSARRIGAIERGGYVGEVSLLDPGPANATVRSEEGATVLVLERTSLGAFTADHPRGGSALVAELGRILAQRVRRSLRELTAPIGPLRPRCDRGPSRPTV